VLPEPIGPRRTAHRLLEVSAFLLAGVGVSLALMTWRYFFDLKVYWGAVHYWVSGGSIYDFVSPDSTYGFTYTPFAALVLLPLALMSFPVAIVAACVADVVVTVQVIRWFIEPVAKRHGWTPWYAVSLVLAFAITFDPLRETFLFGQVNMYLVALVGFDLLILLRRGSRFAGVGIGLATAFKLTPGVFLIYLLVTKRWRAALTACSAAAGATLVGAALAPDASRIFWTDALWNTGRVGQLEYVSNQSLQGAVARLNPQHPNMVLWLLAVATVLVVWFLRVRKVAARGDDKAGFALTGIVTCLISPITWIHHLVWLMPALLLLVDRALDRTGAPLTSGRRAWRWGLLIGSFVILGSRVIWAYDVTWHVGVNLGIWFVSNAYVWVSIALLVGLPLTAAPVRATPTPTTRSVPTEPVPVPEPALVLAGRRKDEVS
jgi:alpha-1,2-mannosyltransferase